MASAEGRKEKGKRYGRGQHPNSRANLEKGMAKPGDVLNPNGKPPGTRDRATVFRSLLDLKVNVKDPETGGQKTVTLYEAAALGQIQSAMKGNTNAWKEIQDSLHGKQAERVQIDLTKLTDEELEQLESIAQKIT